MERGMTRFIVTLAAAMMINSCLSIIDTGRPFREDLRAADEASARGEYAEAEKQYKAALDLAKQNGVENSDFILVTGNLARLYSAEKRDAEAETLFRQRLSIAEKVWSNDPKSLLFVYDDLAIFYLLRDRYDDAHPLYLKSLDLRAQAFGVNAPQVAQG